MYYQSLLIETKNNLNRENNEHINILIKNIKDLFNLKEEDIDKDLIHLITLVEGKKSIGIEEIHHLIEWNSKKSGKIKIAIILESENLTLQAQNSLLKILEEPNLNTIICLQTSKKSKLLDTVKSRCRTLKVDLENKLESNSILIEFLNLNYLERSNYLENLSKDPLVDKLLNQLCHELYDYIFQNFMNNEMKKEYLDMIEFIEKVFEGKEKNVNSKLILEFLNINLINLK
jgi:DNA polymerase III delta prime subunit